MTAPLTHLLGSPKNIHIELYLEARRFNVHVKTYAAVINGNADKHPELWAVAGLIGTPNRWHRQALIATMTVEELEAVDPGIAREAWTTLMNREPLFAGKAK